MATKYSRFRSRFAPRKTRGSVLVFAIVIIAILAMLGTTFLLLVKQSGRAATNFELANTSVEAENTGRDHAIAFIRECYQKQAIFTESGVFSFAPNPPNANAPYLESLQPTTDRNTTDGAPWVSPMQQFSAGAGVSPLTSAVLWDGSDAASPHWTISPLAINASGDDRAHRWWLPMPQFPITPTPATPYVSGVTRLNDLPNVKTLARSAKIRGDYFVWVRDLDSNLHALPQNWMMDTANVPAALDTITLGKNILYQIKATASPELQTLIDADLDTLSTTSPLKADGSPTFQNQQDFALALTSLENTANYNRLRAEIDSYFTTFVDRERLCKPAAGALNINTASEPLIAAALSQIPASGGAGLTLGSKPANGQSQPITLSTYIAKRIVAKRPFTCRMDLEDFIAAQLDSFQDIDTPTTNLGSIYYSIPFRSKDPTKIGGRTELSVQQYLDSVGVAGNLESSPSVEAMLYASAMQKRFRFFADDTGVDQEGNALSGFARHTSTVPGVVPGLTVTEMNNLLNSVSNNFFNVSTTQPTPGDDTQITAPLSAGVVVIHAGPDGIIQAVPGGDDVRKNIIVAGVDGVLHTTPKPGDIVVQQPSVSCILPVTAPLPTPTGDDLYVATPFGGIILAGVNGTFETLPAPGNVIGKYDYSFICPASGAGTLVTAPIAPDLLCEAILSGANGIAETSVIGFSYYSHDYVAPDYKPKVTYSNDAAKFTNPQLVGKFIYGRPENSYEPKNTSNYNYLIADLLRWSCIGDGRRSGYYDMFFNHDDVMVQPLDYKVKDSSTPPNTQVKVVDPGADNVLRTGWGSDDIEEETAGDAVDAETIVVSPGPNGDLETKPKPGNITVQAIAVGSSGISAGVLGDDVSVFGSNSLEEYILPGPNGKFDPDTPGDYDAGRLVNVIVGDGGYDATGSAVQGATATTTVDNDDTLYVDTTVTPNRQTIINSANARNDTFVWGPIRASQRPIDQVTLTAVTLNADEIPSAAIPGKYEVPPVGAKADGDVQWSPIFCFRSRFYGIYVLGRGLAHGWDPADPASVDGQAQQMILNGLPAPAPGSPPSALYLAYLKQSKIMNDISGERRLEAVYDAALDKVIWQRESVTEKRSLGDPP